MAATDYAALTGKMQLTWEKAPRPEDWALFIVVHEKRSGAYWMIAGRYEKHAEIPWRRAEGDKLVAAGMIRKSGTINHWQSKGLGVTTKDALRPYIRDFVTKNLATIQADW